MSWLAGLLRTVAPILATVGLTGILAAQDNILLLIADDLGVDRVGVYAEHPSPGNTPNIDALAAAGMLFRNAWSNPACSPTPTAILTGRHAFRTGVGTVVQPQGNWALGLDEVTLPEMLTRVTEGAFTSVILGKWHLGSVGIGGPDHPLLSGFKLHVGSLAKLGNYYSWQQYVNETSMVSTEYATTSTVTNALRILSELPQPWFCWVAFNAPHAPFHAPPDNLHTMDLSGTPTPVESMKAMTEALDTEIGRLLSSLDSDVLAHTNVLFVGDNGTHKAATTPPFDKFHAKGTVFEGGVNVPLIVSGPAVSTPGSECQALVQTTDLFATIVELASGRNLPRAPGSIVLDSVSMVPYFHDPAHPSLHHFVYTELFSPNGNGPYTTNNRAMRDQRYKLIRKETQIVGPNGPMTVDVDALYDLKNDPFEAQDLLSLQPLTAGQQAAYDDLKAAFQELLSS